MKGIFITSMIIVILCFGVLIGTLITWIWVGSSMTSIAWKLLATCGIFIVIFAILSGVTSEKT